MLLLDGMGVVIPICVRKKKKKLQRHHAYHVPSQSSKRTCQGHVEDHGQDENLGV